MRCKYTFIDSSELDTTYELVNFPADFDKSQLVSKPQVKYYNCNPKNQLYLFKFVSHAGNDGLHEEKDHTGCGHWHGWCSGKTIHFSFLRFLLLVKCSAKTDETEYSNLINAT